VPDAVKDFVFELQTACRSSQILDDIQVLYDHKFRELSQAYFKEGPWPTSSAVAAECGGDDLFLLFYGEMRCRHLFATMKAGLPDRLEAWDCYCRLFDKLLLADDTSFLISSQWAFDIIHEFVYQFQSFCQFRTQVGSRSESEAEVLSERSDLWAVQNVLTYLHRLSRISCVVQIMEAHRLRQPPPQGPSNMHLMLGYYSIIGISRLETLLGDYRAALEILAPLDVTDKSELFTTSLTCHLNLFYHLGFAYLMLRRYRDAARTLNDILSHIHRITKQGQLVNNPSADQVGKLGDKMLSLLTIATHLCTGCKIDDPVEKMMRDKHADKARAMDQGREEPYVELFVQAAPKFIVPSIPDYSQPINYSQDNIKLQLRRFKEEVGQQLQLPKIRSYLKLYSTISMGKLARFCEMSVPELRRHLMALKHKMRQEEHTSGTGALEGSRISHALDINYYVKDDIIHVEEACKEQRYDNYFLSQISKCQECTDTLSRIALL